MPQPPSSSRRRFLTGLAAGAALAPLAALARAKSLAESPGPFVLPTPICSGPALLTPSDLSYLGRYTLPVDDPTGAKTRFGFSLGNLTGRRVSGALRLFVSGTPTRAGGGDYNKVGDGLYEVSLPGSIGGRCTLVRNWGDVTAGKRPRRDPNQGAEIRGWSYNNGRFWWAYGSEYFTGFNPDPSIGVSVLNDGAGTLTAYGPWRTQDHSQKTRGYMVTIPDDFAAAYTNGHTLAVGAPPTSGNANGPRGSVLVALDNTIALATTPDVATSPSASPAELANPHWTLACQRLLYHDAAHPQERNANYRVCGWNVLYDDAQGGPLDPGDPNFNNNSQALDLLNCAAWVTTATRQGIVFFGQMTDVVPGKTYASDGVPHMWYGPADHPCRHGHTSGDGGTGPKSASLVPVLCIYDPAHLAQAATGALTPWGFPAASLTRLNALSSQAFSAQIFTNYTYGGMYFDPVEDRLYVTDTWGENIGEPRPVIHVFQVA